MSLYQTIAKGMQAKLFSE